MMLWHLGTLRTQQGTAPSRVSKPLEITKDLPGNRPLICKPTNPESPSACVRFLQFRTLTFWPTSLQGQGLGTWRPLLCREPTEIKLSNPKPAQLAYLAAHIPSRENWRKSFCLPSSPPPPTASWWLLCGLMGCAVPPTSRDLWV